MADARIGVVAQAKTSSAIRAWQKYGRAVDKALVKQQKTAKRQTDQLQRSTGKLGRSLQGLTGRMSLMSVAGGGLAVTLGAMGAAALRASVGLTANLETALSEVATISSFSADEQARVREEIDRLARVSGSSQVSLAKSLYQIISAGATDAAEAVSVLDATSRLSVAGLAEQADTAKLLTSVMNAYNLSASKNVDIVSDMLLKTVELGVTTIPQLAGSIGRVATIAATANVPLNELLAAIAVLTQAGLSTEEAMTAIRSSIASIIKPTQEASRLAFDLGLNFSAAEIKSRGYLGIMRDIAEATEGDLDVLGQLIPELRALNAVTGLTSEGGLKKFEAGSDAIAAAQGKTNEALKEFNDDLAKEFSRNLQGLATDATTLGDALSGVGTAVLRFFRSVREGQQQLFGGPPGTAGLAPGQPESDFAISRGSAGLGAGRSQRIIERLLAQISRRGAVAPGAFGAQTPGVPGFLRGRPLSAAELLEPPDFDAFAPPRRVSARGAFPGAFRAPTTEAAGGFVGPTTPLDVLAKRHREAADAALRLSQASAAAAQGLGALLSALIRGDAGLGDVLALGAGVAGIAIGGPVGGLVGGLGGGLAGGFRNPTIAGRGGGGITLVVTHGAESTARLIAGNQHAVRHLDRGLRTESVRFARTGRLA